MTRSLARTLVASLVALGGLGPALEARPAADEVSTPVAAPFNLAIRNLTWNGDPHQMPFGRAVLEADDQQAIWELADVTTATASADGSTVALLTRDYQVFVSRLPETPRPIGAGPYLSPRLSGDGTLLVAQRLGNGGHILVKTFHTRGIALINLVTGENRLIVEGNDLHSPSFASDAMVFFGSGALDQVASLYLLDLESMSVARVTNRTNDARQTFPSEAPRLEGGVVAYRADDEQFRVAAPAARDFVPVFRFEAPKLLAAEDASPDFGWVRLRRPNTQVKSNMVFAYFDVNRGGSFKDWNCKVYTYNQHEGTDINQDYGRDVVAPASGTVIMRNDGCADSNSQGCGLGWGNWVAIEHSDGSVSLEAHGKKWTVVAVRTTHACGATLMQSAASGNANGAWPHIHHETWADAGAWSDKTKRYDPYQGPCDASDPSKWSQQNGYKNIPGSTCTH